MYCTHTILFTGTVKSTTKNVVGCFGLSVRGSGANKGAKETKRSKKETGTASAPLLPTMSSQEKAPSPKKESDSSPEKKAVELTPEKKEASPLKKTVISSDGWDVWSPPPVDSLKVRSDWLCSWKRWRALSQPSLTRAYSIIACIIGPLCPRVFCEVQPPPSRHR